MNSRHLGQVVPVPKIGVRGDCDFVKRVSKAGHGIDIGMRSLAFPVTPPCVRVRTRRFVRIKHQKCSAARPRLLAYFKVQEHEEPNPRL
jgi:hypothetical protein